MNAYRRCAERGCPFTGPWLEYCPEHHADHNGPAAIAGVSDTAIRLDREPAVLPCTRCRSSFGIAPGEALCSNCQRDQQNTRPSGPPIARAQVTTHVEHALPEHDR